MVFLCYSDTLLMYYCSTIENMEHKRGKEIFEEYKERLNAPDISEDERAYYSDIINAVDIYSYDVPIPLPTMFEALERAEQQGKQIQIVPDADFLEGGARAGQCDGWTYHVELK